MAEFKRLLIADVVIPVRLRAIEEEQALAMAQSIVEHGLINPITVRATPNAKGGKYTLVAGAHRLRAMLINGEADIDAMLVECDKAEGQLVEITENLFRNELSVIDRAVFVQSYREIWELKHGKVEAGRPGNRVNITQLIGDEAQAVGGFTRHVADRMGISRESLKLLSRIAENLHPDVRNAVRGTPIADNQSALLKIAKMEPQKQRQTAVAIRTEPDLKKALALVDPPAQLSKKQIEQATLLSRLVTAWEDASEETRNQFLEHIGLSGADELMSEIREAGDE